MLKVHNKNLTVKYEPIVLKSGDKDYKKSVFVEDVNGTRKVTLHSRYVHTSYSDDSVSFSFEQIKELYKILGEIINDGSAA